MARRSAGPPDQVRRLSANSTREGVVPFRDGPVSCDRRIAGLYNQRPTWLANAYAALDRAVWAAYGWPADEVPAEVPEDTILAQLLALNGERAAGRCGGESGTAGGACETRPTRSSPVGDDRPQAPSTFHQDMADFVPRGASRRDNAADKASEARAMSLQT